MLKVLVMKVTKNLQKELFIHVIFQPEEVLLLCETLDLLQGTGLLFQVNFLFAEQLKNFLDKCHSFQNRGNLPSLM